MSDDLVNRLQTLSHPASEFLPDGKRLTLLILIAREAADYIEHQHVSHVMMVEEIERLTRERDAHVSGWMKQCEIATAAIKRAEAAERKVEKLREALRPFAALADSYDESYDEPWKVSWYGDLRRARAALRETEG